MVLAVEIAFDQDEGRKQSLLDTGNLQIVEASNDNNWGGGEPMDSPAYYDGTFDGCNNYGLALTLVRNKYTDPPAPSPDNPIPLGWQEME